MQERFDRLRILAGSLLLALAVLAGGQGRACAVCIDLPDATTADRLLADWIVVLARPSADDPYRFAPVEVLAGDPAILRQLPPIPFLVDTPARRRFALDPDLFVVMTYGAQDTGPGDEGWFRLITVSSAHRTTLDAILDQGASWDWGSTADPARFAFFARRLNHPDPVIRRMALTEVSRAPYALIRTLDNPLPLDTLRRAMTEKAELPFLPLYILLTGLSEDPEAPALVRQRFMSALEHAGLRSDAWIVAGLEVDGIAALPAVSARLERDPSLKPDARVRVLSGLTVAGNGHPELRGPIMDIFSAALARDPGLAETLAYTSYGWRDWTLVPQFRAILEGSDEIAHPTRYILDILLSTAGQSG